MAMYGLWNAAGALWVRGETGKRLQTNDPDLAFETLRLLRSLGAVGVTVRPIPPEEEQFGEVSRELQVLAARASAAGAQVRQRALRRVRLFHAE